MEKSLLDLVDKHPKIFPNGFYFESLPGWYALLDTLCFELQKQTDQYGDPQIEAIQIKEKYGTLRFYVKTASEQQYAMIERAEDASAQVCDICGSPGTLRSGSWMRTRCEKHRAPDQHP